MKMDKEALAKNLFWFALGGFVAVWLITLLSLKFGASSLADAGVKEYKAAQDSITSAASKKARNEVTFINPWVDRAKEYEGIKNKVWHEAWELQNPKGRPLVTWPRATSDRIKNELDYPGSWTSDKDIADYLRLYRDSLYLSQFKMKDAEGKEVYLDYQIAPIEFKGLKAGFESIMAPETGSAGGAGGPGPGPAPGPGPGRREGERNAPGGLGRPNANGGHGGGGGGGGASGPKDINKLLDSRKVPTFEEAFLAQEDFWIKRDLLDVIRDARDSSARMPVVKSADAKDDTGFKTTPTRIDVTFRNSTWELHLAIIKKEVNNKESWVIGPASTIKNVSSAKRTMDLKKGARFLLRQNDLSDEFTFDGEMLAWNQEPLKLNDTVSPKNVLLDREFEVEQVFDWDLSPIKQVVDLRVGYNSHRTAATALKPGIAFKPAAADANAPPAAAPAAAPPGDPGVALAPAGPSDVTDRNNLQRNRYLHVTAECRHVPIAMVLIVDQAHIHNVLLAVANSRLRIQTTQVHFQQTTGVTSQLEGEKTGEGPSETRPGVKPPTAGPGPGPRPGPGTGPTGGLSSSTPQEDPNLVELTIYGIASLYERYPPRKVETPGAQPGDPTTTPTPPQPAPK